MWCNATLSMRNLCSTKVSRHISKQKVLADGGTGSAEKSEKRWTSRLSIFKVCSALVRQHFKAHAVVGKWQKDACCRTTSAAPSSTMQPKPTKSESGSSATSIGSLYSLGDKEPASNEIASAPTTPATSRPASTRFSRKNVLAGITSSATQVKNAASSISLTRATNENGPVKARNLASRPLRPELSLGHDNNRQSVYDMMYPMSPTSQSSIPPSGSAATPHAANSTTASPQNEGSEHFFSFDRPVQGRKGLSTPQFMSLPDPEPAERRFRCTHANCTESFERYNQLVRHINSAHGETTLANIAVTYR
jgi:hypothetical protein